MRLISWNVNGLRACIGKGFYDFAQSVEADIISVQETKMQPGQAAVELSTPPLMAAAVCRSIKSSLRYGHFVEN